MISHFKLTSTAATVDYHADAFDKERTREGALDEQPTATWGGTGAHLAGLGIGSEVQKSDFEDVLNGKIGGQQIAGGYSAERDEKYHKPGMDFTFSPGKSVSITALVGGDDRIKSAHSAAVETAMQWLEKNGSRARANGEEKDTGNLLYAKFDHETSRKNDPQLHTHVVIANATFDQDSGKWKAMENKELLTLRKEADAIYGQALEKNLQSLGYRTEPGKSGPEIQGINQEQREAFSVRSSDIDKYLQNKGLSRETASPGQKQVANLATRPDKSPLPMAQLKEIWQQKAQAVGLAVEQMSAKRTPPKQLTPREPAKSDDVVKAVEKVVDGMNGAAQRFDTLSRTLPELQDKDTVKAVDEMRNLRALQYPKTATQIKDAVREELPGRYVAQEKVESALTELTKKGKLEREPGAGDAADRYAIDRKDQERGQAMQQANARVKQPDGPALERTVARVVERMDTAGKMFDGQAALAKKSDDRAQVKDMLPAITRYRNEQAPKTTAQIARTVRDESPSLKYASNEKVQEALDRLEAAGAVKRAPTQEADSPTRYAPDPARSEERSQSYKELRESATQPTKGELDKAVVGVFSRMNEAGAKFDQQADSALKSDSRSVAKAAMPQLEELRKEQAPKSVAQISAQLKADNPELKYATKEQVQEALDRLEASGTIQRNSNSIPARYSHDFEKDSERYSTFKAVQDTSKQPTRTELDNAVESVVDRMRAGLDDLAHITKERREAWAEDKLDRAATADSKHKEVSKDIAYSVPEMREKVKDSLARSGVLEKLDKNNNGDASKVADAKIDEAIMRAVDRGELHKNLNKLSVETEAQTDSRLAEDTATRSGHKSRLSQVKSDTKSAERNGLANEKAAERKEAALTKLKQAGIKYKPPSVADDITKVITRTVRTTARAIGNPQRAATRFIKNGAIGTVKVAAKVGETAALVPATVAVAGSVSIAKGLATQAKVVNLTLKGKRDELTKLRNDVVDKERSLQKRTGYFADDLGRTKRMELTGRNAVLTAAVAAISITGLGHTTGGRAARNSALSMISTTKVSATEAAIAKATVAVGRQVGRAVNTVASGAKEAGAGYAKMVKKVGSMAAEATQGLGKAADYAIGAKDKQTVEKAVGSVISAVTDKSRAAQVLAWTGGQHKAAELSQEARKEAYSKYIQASVALGERQREVRELPQKSSPQEREIAMLKVEKASEQLAAAKKNLVRVGEGAVRVADKLESKVFTQFSEKTVSKYAHEKVVEQRDFLKSAVEEMKQELGRADKLENLDKALDAFSSALKSDPKSADYGSKLQQAKADLAKAVDKAVAVQVDNKLQTARTSSDSPSEMKAYLSDSNKLDQLKDMAKQINAMDTSYAEHNKRLPGLVADFKTKIASEIKATNELKTWSVQNQQRFTGLNNRDLLKAQAQAGRDHIGNQLKPKPANTQTAQAQRNNSQIKNQSRQKSYGMAY